MRFRAGDKPRSPPPLPPNYPVLKEMTAKDMLLFTFLYPSAVEDVNSISHGAQMAKIARHSPCSVEGCRCQGLHPFSNWVAVTDDSEDVAEILELAETSSLLTEDGFLRYCECQHTVDDHGGTTDHVEMTRRARVAVRIDQLLEVTETRWRRKQFSLTRVTTGPGQTIGFYIYG